MSSITTPAELYAHAIALEREAAERYREFAGRMKDEAREDLAEGVPTGDVRDEGEPRADCEGAGRSARP